MKKLFLILACVLGLMACNGNNPSVQTGKLSINNLDACRYHVLISTIATVSEDVVNTYINGYASAEFTLEAGKYDVVYFGQTFPYKTGAAKVTIVANKTEFFNMKGR